jgi:hypothetical protein
VLIACAIPPLPAFIVYRLSSIALLLLQMADCSLLPMLNTIASFRSSLALTGAQKRTLYNMLNIPVCNGKQDTQLCLGDP